MTQDQVAQQATDLSLRAQALADAARGMTVATVHAAGAVEPFVFLLAVFLLACFVGYYVVWNVTPALHSPLMSVTNAISSVIVVGAMLATLQASSGVGRAFGFLAVTLASVNIFGGFMVTRRMLGMFRRRAK